MDAEKNNFHVKFEEHQVYRIQKSISPNLLAPDLPVFVAIVALIFNTFRHTYFKNDRFKILSRNFQLFDIMYCKFFCCPFLSIVIGVGRRQARTWERFFFELYGDDGKHVSSFIVTKKSIEKKIRIPTELFARKTDLLCSPSRSLSFYDKRKMNRFIKIFSCWKKKRFIVVYCTKSLYCSAKCFRYIKSMR